MVLRPHRATVRELFRKGGQALSPETKMGEGPKSRVRRGPAGTQLGKDCCRSRVPATASLPDEADPATPGPQLGPPWASRPSEVTTLALCLCLSLLGELARPCRPCWSLLPSAAPGTFLPGAPQVSVLSAVSESVQSRSAVP